MRAWFAVLLIAVAGCESSQPPPTESTARSSEPASSSAPSFPPQPVLPANAAQPSETNPLRLPARKISLDAGKRAFTFSEPMLSGARIGSTLVLYAATVTSLDGDDLLIEGRGGPAYKVQNAYAISVPDDPKIRPGDAVLTEWAGVMKHALVTKFLKDKIMVRFTDLDAKAPEATLKMKGTRFVRQVEGFEPGNYAALHDGDDLRHVLLVSPFSNGGKKMWFALGYGGAAMNVEESALVPIPIRFNPKVGATILAESVGTMRRAVVVSADDPGLFTVRYARAGRPAKVGWGLVMPGD